MFNSKRIAELENRIDRLEMQVDKLIDHSRITVHYDAPVKTSIAWGTYPGYQYMSLKDAVEMLADHQGVEFKYVVGTPDTFAIKNMKSEIKKS